MLVLSLNPGEAARINLPGGEVIRVILVRSHKDTTTVRIGFEADRRIKILREELLGDKNDSSIEE